MRILFVFISMAFFCINGVAQTLPRTESQIDSAYQHNIRLSKINGVYIPRNLEEAYVRLQELTPPESIAKFKNASETEVCKKLHFGIGRWMIVNWNFYQGSRLSHYLKEKGISHPDDMAQFILRGFHRHLNGADPAEKALIDELTSARQKEVEYLKNN